MIMLDGEFTAESFEDQRLVADDENGRKEASSEDDDDGTPKDPQSEGFISVDDSSKTVAGRGSSKFFELSE